MFDSFKFFIFIAILAIASIHDIKTRKVPNLIWLPALVSGLVFNYLQLQYQYNTLPFNWFLGFALTTLMGIVTCLILAGIIYKKEKSGGADSKAVLLIGLTYACNPLFIIITTAFAYLSSSVIGIKFKRIPWIPSLTLGYLCTAILFGGIL